MNQSTRLTALALAFAVVAGLGSAHSAHAQTTTQAGPVVPAAVTAASTTGGVMNTTGAAAVTPGAPNTGAGGNATLNIALLIGSGLLAISGAAYLGRTYAQQR